MNRNGKLFWKPEVTSGKMSIRSSKSSRRLHSRQCYLLYAQWAKLLRVVSRTKPVPSQLLLSYLGHSQLVLVQGLGMGTAVIPWGCFPLVSGTTSLLFSPCRRAVLSASPGALHGPLGKRSWLLSAITSLLPWSFCCQKQQDTLIWPCWCSLSMQLIGKTITRFQRLNLS